LITPEKKNKGRGPKKTPKGRKKSLENPPPEEWPPPSPPGPLF